MIDGSHAAERDAARLELLRRLDDEGYAFVTPTPATHARVLRRRAGQLGEDLRDILGWSLPFRPGGGPAWLPRVLDAAGVLVPGDDRLLRSLVRVSRLHGRLVLHSAYPTDQPDAVFFGPDSYRFADLIHAELPADLEGAVVDVGGGAGVGAIVAARRAPRAQVTLTDVNPQALALARVNAAHAGVQVRLVQADGLQAVGGGLAAVVANPPYMASSGQTYRDGGDLHGGRLSLDWARAALDRLAPDGRLILYTGTAIVTGGHDELRRELGELAAEKGAEMAYRELDPDVFGEDLLKPAYADVERIAVVACLMRG